MFFANTETSFGKRLVRLFLKSLVLLAFLLLIAGFVYTRWTDTAKIKRLRNERTQTMSKEYVLSIMENEAMFFYAALALAAILAVVLGLCAFSAMRMGYEEDISAFLPQDEESARYSEIYAKLGGQDRIAVFFKGDDEEEIMEKMLSFEDAWAEADTAGLIPDVRAQVDMGSASEVFSFISANYPYFLTGEDIARADSLLSVPGYIGTRLDEVKQNLYSPLNPFGTKYYRSDPLGLFLPVIERLSAMDPTGGANLRDGYLFTPDGTTGIILFSSPHSGSESGENAKIAALLEDVIGKIVLRRSRSRRPEGLLSRWATHPAYARTASSPFPSRSC